MNDESMVWSSATELAPTLPADLSPPSPLQQLVEQLANGSITDQQAQDRLVRMQVLAHRRQIARLYCGARLRRR